MPRTSRTSRHEPDSFKAIDAKHNLEAIAEVRKVTTEEINVVLNVFKENLSNEDYNIFEGQLSEALYRKDELNDKLTRKYYNKHLLIIIVLNVFTNILPGLIKANIPENIVSLVIIALRMYNLQLLNYYYHFFVDPHNLGIKEVQEKKAVNANLHMKIEEFAFEHSQQSKIFADGHYKLMQGLISIKKDVETFMAEKQIFLDDQKNRLRFVFLYLAIFIVMLYIAMHFNYDEFKNMLENLNKIPAPTPVHLLGASPRVSLHNGGKKNNKSNNSTKPKKRAAVIKKVSPKKVSPKKASPKKTSPKKASPKKVSPKI
jgi:hypothetical protein